MTAHTIINKELFDRFLPLNLIPLALRDEVIKHAMITSFDVCKNIVKHSDRSTLYHYLIDGYAEIRHSFNHRTNISSDGEKSCYPLEEHIQRGGVVRAVTPCRVMIINRDYVHEIMTHPESKEYDVVHLDSDIGHQNQMAIDDEYKSDWMTIFYQSQLASNLSANKIQQVLNNLINVNVTCGQTIIECHSAGDCFYIIKEGYAEVITDQSGPFKGDKFTLEPGDYFGDEALVADTIRNASIVMMTDGIIGKMDPAVFGEVIKNALVVTPSTDEFIHLPHPVFYDVRLPFEYKQSHLPASINIPLGEIRNHLPTLDRERVYVITHEGGRRSELATYLMRQAGIEAYYMDDVLFDALPAILGELNVG
ncbi:hypothetical protein A9Q99_00130 [Gammaproteobacteria bacterium 45_16_T64]|nr:hypothetical protein A9Q99_00130 [Gammaproteobacteria bacterium 45_16_T64]